MQSTPPTHPAQDPPILTEHGGHVIYPMPVFARVATPDPARLVTFFTEVLDFAIVFAAPEIGGLPSLVHLRRAKYQDVLVVPASGAVVPDPGLVVTFQAGDADAIDALGWRIGAANPAILDGPQDTPWSTRDLSVTDPDGRTWTFTARGRGPLPGRIDAVPPGPGPA